MSNEPLWGHVQLQPSGLRFAVQPGQSLLEAALASGVHMPRSCRNGTCRACMCQLLSGQVRYRIEWPGLSPDEKDEGWILPCVALPLGDVVLEAPSARRLGDGGGT
ncbi:MAG: 2Fe-2S iron-sulfur cluster binding domain-containing protein [Aquabacterium sp.]|nr:2Fe-2S iron-sulfur cluster binding domain-containing protein [Aquabacterium sp.]